jgi:hypothetical protein
MSTKTSASTTATALTLGGLTPDDIALLEAPFPEEQVGWRVGSYNRDLGKKEVLSYAPWSAYVERLNQIDPNWSYLVESSELSLLGSNQFGAKYGMVFKVALTIKGVTRYAVGAGLGEPSEKYDPFEMTVMGAESDTLKRACAKFGLGKQFYEKNLMTREEAEAKAGSGNTRPSPSRPSGGNTAAPRSSGGGSGFQMNPAQAKRAYAIARDKGFDGDNCVNDYVASVYSDKDRDSFFSREEMDTLLTHEFGSGR